METRTQAVQFLVVLILTQAHVWVLREGETCDLTFQPQVTASTLKLRIRGSTRRALRFGFFRAASFGPKLWAGVEGRSGWKIRRLLFWGGGPLGVPSNSPFFSRDPDPSFQETILKAQGKRIRFLKRTMVEKNGQPV